jgi:transcriptional regulator with XRE-family HTH domain
MTIQQMLEALLGAGLSQQEIAGLTGVSQPTICRAHRGAEVLYKSGKQIERLYQERLGDKAAA